MVDVLEQTPYGFGTLDDGSFERTMSAVAKANPDYRLVGSLGRAVLWDKHYGNPYLEYDARGERPLANRHHVTRDLDFLNAPDLPDITTPYPIDTVWADNQDASITQNSGGEWRLKSVRRGFDEPIDAEVMAPVHGKTVYGVETTTVNPMTHMLLFAIRGTLRRQDDRAVNMLSQLLTTDDCPILPYDKYEPFWELADMQRHGALAKLSHVYRRYVPRPIVGLTGDFLFALKNRNH
jgi:hypothetical protein